MTSYFINYKNMPTLKQFVTAVTLAASALTVSACAKDPVAARQECEGQARQERIKLQEALLRSGSAGDDGALEVKVRTTLDECLRKHGISN